MAAQQFLWGAVTSAYKVEGNNVHSADLATIGAAADHWNRWPSDFGLMAQLGLTAYRFSVDWSRIESQAGQFNQAAIEHYREMLKELKRLNMQTFLVLQDGPWPSWFREAGGWLSPQAPQVFSKYAHYVAQHVGDLVDGWVILNTEAIDKQGWLRDIVINHRMRQAQTLAAKAIRAGGPLAHIHGYDWASLDIGGVGTDDLLSFLRKKTSDRKPVYIVDSHEFTDDAAQADFIRTRLQTIEEAQAGGINIRGYFYDSLLDGVEVAKDLPIKKGLIAVDLATQKRSVRPFAHTYTAIIKQATQTS